MISHLNIDCQQGSRSFLAACHIMGPEELLLANTNCLYTYISIYFFQCQEVLQIFLSFSTRFDKLFMQRSLNQEHLCKSKIANQTILHRGFPLRAKEFNISCPERVLLYYLQTLIPGCECEEPFQNKYKYRYFSEDRRPPDCD